MTDAGWSTGPAPAPTVPAAEKPLSALAQSALGHYGGTNAVIEAWRVAAQELAVAKEMEARLRNVVFEIMFPDPKEGTNRAEIGDGRCVKVQYPFTYRLTNKEAAAEKAIDAMTAISQQAGFVADRLIQWEPELSIKEYRLLNPDNPAGQTPEQKAILALLQPILTIKPGMPQMEIEQAKR